ncbi:MAG: hypothetical protein KatS3mg060_0343 [Dehalococcoidia bacterium]|nr:MAG: hypothetical protein KatS3mg060_0343 [Dehalococcoidia bacterium]
MTEQGQTAQAIVPHRSAGSRALAWLRNERPMVLAIPRGSRAVAAHVVEGESAEVDNGFTPSVGALANPKRASGAVKANGGRYLNRAMIDRLDAPARCLDTVPARRAEAEPREHASVGWPPTRRAFQPIAPHAGSSRRGSSLPFPLPRRTGRSRPTARRTPSSPAPPHIGSARAGDAPNTSSLLRIPRSSRWCEKLGRRAPIPPARNRRRLQAASEP